MKYIKFNYEQPVSLLIYLFYKINCRIQWHEKNSIDKLMGSKTSISTNTVSILSN